MTAFVEDARTATADDLPRIVELAEMARAELAGERDGSLWLRVNAAPVPVRATYAAALADADVRVVLGCIDAVIIGYGVVKVGRLADGSSLGTVTDLFVEPDARAIGIGDAISTALVAFCVERGCIGVDATALPGSRATKNFFEGHGFVARALTMHHRLQPREPR